MRTCVWYDMEEKAPPKTGYYLAFKGLSIGDDQQGCDYYYWDARWAKWRDSQISSAYHVNVIYWTEADPASWYENYSIRHTSRMTPAEQDAWNEVQRAIEKYEVVKALVR